MVIATSRVYSNLGAACPFPPTNNILNFLAETVQLGSCEMELHFSNWVQPSLSRVVLYKLNSRSADQEMPRHLWKPRIQHHVHKSLKPGSVLNQMTQARTEPYNLLPLRFVYLIVLSTLMSPLKGFHGNLIFMFYLLHAWFMSRPSHPSLFDHPNINWKSSNYLQDYETDDVRSMPFYSFKWQLRHGTG
jgi:hypothetical protein